MRTILLTKEFRDEPSSTTSVTYSASDTYFQNANKFKINSTYYTISSINTALNTITVTTATGASYSTYYIGYQAIEYIPIVKTIKDCLDAKVAALPSSACPCKDKQVNTLMNMYMLYDAMFINAANVNLAKSVDIYNILSNFCADSDCKCNG